jgi:hypothetical protein
VPIAITTVSVENSSQQTAAPSARYHSPPLVCHVLVAPGRIDLQGGSAMKGTVGLMLRVVLQTFFTVA